MDMPYSLIVTKWNYTVKNKWMDVIKVNSDVFTQLNVITKITIDENIKFVSSGFSIPAFLEDAPGTKQDQKNSLFWHSDQFNRRKVHL